MFYIKHKFSQVAMYYFVTDQYHLRGIQLFRHFLNNLILKPKQTHVYNLYRHLTMPPSRQNSRRTTSKSYDGSVMKLQTIFYKKECSD